jgi:purine-binding chemotaxis protein CheW
MRTTGRKSSEIPEDRGSVPAGTREAMPEEKRKILRARAKSLVQEPERKGEDNECLEVLAFILAHETYAIETRFIREVYPLTELTSLPCTPAYISGIINIRGQILTIIDMKKFLDLSEKGITNLNRVIVVRNDAVEFGILADEIIGIKRIFGDDIKLPPATIAGIGAEYLKGVTEDRLIVLEADKVLSDKRLVVHEEVEK